MQQREQVTSSVIVSAGYDEEEAMLEIEFVSGRIYRYFDVGPEVWDDFWDAPSKGAFFNAEIRDAYLSSQVK